MGLIESYHFGHIEIGGRSYRNDVKVIGSKVVPDWWRSQGHLVQIKDVRDLLAANARFCVFGTGAYGAMRVSDAVKSELESQGIEVLIEPTEAACETYNRLIEEGESAVAGFHLSC
jgi:hypothetical protein